jgi:hypothetical protein
VERSLALQSPPSWLSCWHAHFPQIQFVVSLSHGLPWDKAGVFLLLEKNRGLWGKVRLRTVIYSIGSHYFGSPGLNSQQKRIIDLIIIFPNHRSCLEPLFLAIEERSDTVSHLNDRFVTRI